jgi:hypothetical protein
VALEAGLLGLSGRRPELSSPPLPPKTAPGTGFCCAETDAAARHATARISSGNGPAAFLNTA